MFTRTKIICTIGPATSELITMQKMYSAGMNVVRINMSHASHDEALNVIKNVKLINKNPDIKKGPISILIDTQGPEIRTGDRDTSLDLKLGDKVNLTVRDEVDVETSSIKINYRGLINSVKKGSKISVDNGLVNFKVLEKHDDKLLRRVIDGGKIGSKRSVNLPGVRIDLPSITKKDKADINFAIKHDVDYIALSFVRKIEDIHSLRKILKRKKSQIKIVSKIEDNEGLSNIHAITQESDAVMVARGDLGIETSLADLPNVQRRIMYACSKWGRRSIVATHLLESMIEKPTPTRAEVTDVANTIYEGADAIMLSGETSIGKYPIECIKFLKSIADRSEKFRTLGYEEKLELSSDWEYLAKTARDLAESINADGIIVITRSGYTANLVSNAKPFNVPIYAFTNDKRVHRQLSLVGSVLSIYQKSIVDNKNNMSKIANTLKKVFSKKKKLKFVLISGMFSEKHSDAIRVVNF